MNIGFVNIYSFRPHVEHLFYLSTLMKEAGHSVFFLTCDSSVSNCYVRSMKNGSRLVECSKCMMGGVRSFTGERVTSIKKEETSLVPADLERLTLSSSCSLTRVESEDEWDEPELVAIRQSLHGPVGSTYESARRWINDNRLEGVVCFNGRMELTRAVTEACRKEGIPFITHERTWFGDGLRLVPNANCLSIKAVREVVAEYADKPLTSDQARHAGKLVGERFLQRNSLEWRLYNRNPEPAPWPLATPGKKILVLPSSKNEFAGDDEWHTGWPDNTQAIDDFLSVYGFSPSQLVLRCHPNWSENIGMVSGARSRRLYESWARERGVHCITSDQKASTYDLIQQADLVIMNGGSSAVEAGACGKQVVCMGPSSYDASGFVQCFHSRQEMEASPLMALDPDVIRRLTLRFLYVSSHRFPQFVDYVKAVTTTHYEYRAGADAQRIVEMFKTGVLTADNPHYAATEAEENPVVDDLKACRWGELADFQAGERPSEKTLPGLAIKRRPAFRWVDPARALFARGDR